MGLRPKPETVECKQKKKGLDVFSGFFLSKFDILVSSSKLTSSAWPKCNLAKFVQSAPPHYGSEKREVSEVSWSLLMLHCSADKKDNAADFIWIVDNVMFPVS